MPQLQHNPGQVPTTAGELPSQLSPSVMRNISWICPFIQKLMGSILGPDPSSIQVSGFFHELILVNVL